MPPHISGADRTAAKRAFATITKRIDKMRAADNTPQDLDDRKTFVQVDKFRSRGVSPMTGSAQFSSNGEVKALELTQQNRDGSKKTFDVSVSEQDQVSLYLSTTRGHRDWTGPSQNYVRDTITVLFEPGHNPFHDGFDRLQDVKVEHEDFRTRAADAAKREKEWTDEAEARDERLRASGYKPVYWVDQWLGGGHYD